MSRYETDTEVVVYPANSAIQLGSGKYRDWSHTLLPCILSSLSCRMILPVLQIFPFCEIEEELSDIVSALVL